MVVWKVRYRVWSVGFKTQTHDIILQYNTYILCKIETVLKYITRNNVQNYKHYSTVKQKRQMKKIF